MVDSRTREAPRSARRTSGRSGGRRLQQPAPRQRTRRGRGLFFKFYVFLVFCSAIVVGLYIAHALLVQPPAIPQPEAPDAAGEPSVVPPVSDPEDPNALVRRDGVYNFVLLGKDVDSSNTDTIILVSFDTVQGKIGMISIPRDTAVNRTWSKTPKINAAFHGAGADVLLEEIQNTFGIPVDYYVHVDLKGFIALVDELDGVDIEVPLDMNYDDPYQNPNYISNQWYTDLQRGEFQREVLMALAKKVVSWNSIPKVTSFVDIFNSSVETNLPADDMLYFAEQALKLDLSTAIQQSSLTGRGDGVVRGYQWCYVYEAEDILPTLNSLLNPYTRDLTADDLDLPQADRYLQSY